MIRTGRLVNVEVMQNNLNVKACNVSFPKIQIMETCKQAKSYVLHLYATYSIKKYCRIIEEVHHKRYPNESSCKFSVIDTIFGRGGGIPPNFKPIYFRNWWNLSKTSMHSDRDILLSHYSLKRSILLYISKLT